APVTQGHHGQCGPSPRKPTGPVAPGPCLWQEGETARKYRASSSAGGSGGQVPTSLSFGRPHGPKFDRELVPLTIPNSTWDAWLLYKATSITLLMGWSERGRHSSPVPDCLGGRLESHT
ncbi:hypothetical protein FOZ63_004949, partial [Perkinsus olseni]